MNLVIEKSPLFHADVTEQFRWYVDEAVAGDLNTVAC
jgi:hypothetical protein